MCKCRVLVSACQTIGANHESMQLGCQKIILEVEEIQGYVVVVTELGQDRGVLGCTLLHCLGQLSLL